MRSLPSGSVKNAMWQTPVSRVSPANTTPLGLEFGASGHHVINMEGGVGVLLGRELHAESLRLPDAEARFARPDFEAPMVVRSQPERVDVERARSLGVLRRDGHEVELADHRSLRFMGRTTMRRTDDLRGRVRQR